MKVLNAIFRLFGYEWVKDETPYEAEDDDVMTANNEGWDDIYQQTPRYRLRKIETDNNQEL